jgi:hypothetical protein
LTSTRPQAMARLMTVMDQIRLRRRARDMRVRARA